MSKRPLVSVCIANYNGRDIIDACIASLHAQDCHFSVEIIIHDDASTDSSAHYIRQHYSNIVLIESAENVGFCVANNRMAEVAQGEFILLLNNDAELYPDALRTLHAEAVRSDRPGILSLPQYNAATGELIDIGCLFDPFLNPVPNRDAERHDVGMVIGACLWIPKNVWQELGGFPEWFGSIGEDLYLCSKARLYGYAVRAVGKSGYLHRVGASFGGGKVQGKKLATTFRRRALSERNKTFVMVMTYPLPFLLVMFPVHLALLLLEGVLLSVLRGSGAYLQQIYLPVFAALYRRRKLLSTGRADIMRDHRLSSADFFSVFSWLPYKLQMLLRYGLPRLD